MIHHDDHGCCHTHQTTNKEENHSHNHDHGHSHEHSHGDSDKTILQQFTPAIISFVLLLIGLLFDFIVHPSFFGGTTRFIWYVIAFLPVGIPVLKESIESIRHGDIFSEFLLISIATIGAFAIKEYPEAVTVMLFYAVGEACQDIAVSKARNNIKCLIDQRPDEVNILTDGAIKQIAAKEVKVGDIMVVKPGEKVALDGILVNDSASFNTAALTGESKPDNKKKSEIVLAGFVNLQSLVNIEVTSEYADSKLSKILDLVQNASKQKAPTELFIKRFAKIYTPIVVFLAAAICLVPYFFAPEYHFSEWLNKALVFLVISCPCALVISIPLGYFGGIGAASRNGILMKGGNYIDILAKVGQVVFDKTGTLTKGIFEVQDIQLNDLLPRPEILRMLLTVEAASTHPIATAIKKYVGEKQETLPMTNVQEVAGHGLQADYQGKIFLAGNFKLLEKEQIDFPEKDKNIVATVIALAFDKQYLGYITIADKVKDDAKTAIQNLKLLSIKSTILSGDKADIVQQTANILQVDAAFGDLLPEDKVQKMQEIKASQQLVAFVGDGMNDAPVIALSDVGIAMGGLGSDAAIETAGIVIQDDQPSKVATAIRISKATKNIVWQNITLAFGVKMLIMLLGATGNANMWEAVFADVGVALLAILNAIRIQKKDFR